MDLYALLKLLADGEYHSGSALGHELGVSRTAIWKSLAKLEEIGIPVSSQKGLGYCVPGGLDLLDADYIVSLLPSSLSSRVQLEVFSTLESTNQYLLDVDCLPESGYRFCVAERQTGGRGRRGRQWFSPMAKNIYLSCGFQYTGGVEGLAGLSLVVGIACTEAMVSLGIEGLSIKWPNDIWLHDRKLAGILVELRGEPTTGWQVVVGLGVNVWMERVDEDVVNQAWASLRDYPDLNRSEIVAVIIAHLTKALDEFAVTGFAAFLERWAENDALRGQEVAIVGGKVKGFAQGVDQTGALLLQDDTGVHAINAGEVSVRKQ